MKCISVTMVNTMRKNPLAFVPLGLQGVEMPLSPMSSWKLMVALYRSWSNWMYWTSMKKGSGVVARNQTSSSLGRQLGTWFAMCWSRVELDLIDSQEVVPRSCKDRCNLMWSPEWVTMSHSTSIYHQISYILIRRSSCIQKMANAQWSHVIFIGWHKYQASSGG